MPRRFEPASGGELIVLYCTLAAAATLLAASCSAALQHQHRVAPLPDPDPCPTMVSHIRGQELAGWLARFLCHLAVPPPARWRELLQVNPVDALLSAACAPCLPHFSFLLCILLQPKSAGSCPALLVGLTPGPMSLAAVGGLKLASAAAAAANEVSTRSGAAVRDVPAVLQRWSHADQLGHADQPGHVDSSRWLMRAPEAVSTCPPCRHCRRSTHTPPAQPTARARSTPPVPALGASASAMPSGAALVALAFTVV